MDVCVLFVSVMSYGGYEKVCVLFNMAALQSQVASTQSVENDDGLKTAAKLFQVKYTKCKITKKYWVSFRRATLKKLAVHRSLGFCK